MLAVGGWFMVGPREEESAPESSEVVVDPGPPSAVTKDGADVFRRAFWRHPTENDTILHAERSEWSDADGVQRWQWFIVVDPSPEFASYLLEQNPFSLNKPVGSATMPSIRVPDWFPKSEESLDVWQSAGGGMLIMNDLDSGRLYATSKGHGFAKAVKTNAVSSAQQSSPSGRLLRTPPIHPNR